MNRDQAYITNRLIQAMEQYGVDALVLTWPHSVYYATGFASSFGYTSRDFGMTAAVVNSDGNITLACSDFESHEAHRTAQGVHITTYPMFVFVADFADEGKSKPATGDSLQAVRLAIQEAGGLAGKRVAVEHSSLPPYAEQFFVETWGNPLGEAESVLREAKRVKGTWEVDLIRQGTIISERAMERVGAQIHEGMTYAHAANLFQRYCLEQSDDIVFVDQYHTFGSFFSPTYTMINKPLQTGDIVRLDGGPVVRGYYSDIARNYCVGGSVYATDEQKRIYDALYQGHMRGRALIGPGVKLADVYREVFETVKRCGISNYARGHQGHSIGCGANSEEAPFIAPSEQGLLEPGMVMCLEASYYGSEHHSFNVEDTFVVTENGAEWFSTSPYMFDAEESHTSFVDELRVDGVEG